MSDSDKDFMKYIEKKDRNLNCPFCHFPLSSHNEAMLDACGFLMETFKKANGGEPEPA